MSYCEQYSLLRPVLLTSRPKHSPRRMARLRLRTATWMARVAVEGGQAGSSGMLVSVL